MTAFLAQNGLWAVFVLMAVDAVFPAASELVMLYAGALASGALTEQLVVFGTERSGADAFVAVAVTGTLGYLAGSLVGWWIGRRGGRPFLERHGRWLHLGPARMQRAERWFDRWDDWAVFLGRLTPLARSFISIPAGVFGAPLRRYTVLTFLGSAIGRSIRSRRLRARRQLGDPASLLPLCRIRRRSCTRPRSRLRRPPMETSRRPARRATDTTG